MKWGKLEFDFAPLSAWYTFQVADENATFKTAFEAFIDHVEENNLYKGKEPLTLELLAKQGTFQGFNAWIGEWHERGNADLAQDTES